MADLRLIDGSRPDGECEILGAGPVRPSVLDRLTPDSSVCGIIFGGKAACCGWDATSYWATGPNAWPTRCWTGGACGATPRFTKPSWHHLRDWHGGGPVDIDNLVPCAAPTTGSSGNTIGNW